MARLIAVRASLATAWTRGSAAMETGPCGWSPSGATVAGLTIGRTGVCNRRSSSLRSEVCVPAWDFAAACATAWAPACVSALARVTDCASRLAPCADATAARMVAAFESDNASAADVRRASEDEMAPAVDAADACAPAAAAASRTAV